MVAKREALCWVRFNVLAEAPPSVCMAQVWTFLKSKQNLDLLERSMGIIFGILLTELKILGLSIRSPLLSFLMVGVRFWPRCVVILGILGIYAYPFLSTEDILSLSKLNILTFTLIVFGAYLLFTLSLKNSFSQKSTLRMITAVPIFFFILTALQIIQLSFWEEYFVDFATPTYPRTTGLSSEPSFFANMLFYFFMLYQSFLGKNKLILFVFLILFLSTWTLTLPALFLVLFLVLFTFRLRIGGLKVKPMFLIFLVPCFMLLADQAYVILTKEHLGSFLLQATGSWRELSTYASLYGADLVGPFSGGLEWSDTIHNGQRAMGQGSVAERWLVWPWSLFSMLLCEFGLIPTFLIVGLVGRKLNNVWNRKPYLRPKLKWFTASFIIGFFLAPKWCVYFLFFPLMIKADEKKLSPAQ